MKTRVAVLLREKGSWVLTIAPGHTVLDAIRLMEEKRVGAILVQNEDGGIEGIFTERDYLRRVVLQGRTSATALIEEVMTADVVYVEPGDTIGDCMSVMTQKKCRHLPVVEDGQLKGIVSIGDCVKRISADAQAQVRTLTEYVTGRYPG